MAIGLSVWHHTGWIVKIVDSASHHLLKTVLVLAASGTLAVSLGWIIFMALVQSGNVRLFVMLVPHAFASMLSFMLFLLAIFTLEHRDP